MGRTLAVGWGVERGQRDSAVGRYAFGGLWVLAALLPLVGLASLLMRSQLDPNYDNHKVHFVLFVGVGAIVSVLAYVAGEAATKRGDARVLLMSLAFLLTGGFLALHAVGTPGILFASEHSGFDIAISAGMELAAVFAFASAFVDLRPGWATRVMCHRARLRRGAFAAMALWFAWTVAKLPPLSSAHSEGGTGSLLTWVAVAGALLYAVAAVRYWVLFRERLTLLPASVIA